MAHRFGEFFLDPQWPSQNDENNLHYTNLIYYDEQDEQSCRMDQQEDIQYVKLEFPEESSIDIQKQQESQVISQEKSQSQYIVEESQSSYQNDVENKKPFVKIEPQPQLIKTKPISKERIKSKTRIPLKNRAKKQKKEYERGKYKILSQELKKQIVQQSKAMTMVEVAKKYHVSVNNICRWRKRCDRRSGAGRKVTDMEMEYKLLQWLISQNHPIARKQVQLMAKKMSRLQGFKASKGWFERFYKRNRLHYNPNIEILTHNDYRQRFCKSNQQGSSKHEVCKENIVKQEE